MNTKEELDKELKEMRVKYTKFLNDYAPQIEEINQRIDINCIE